MIRWIISALGYLLLTCAALAQIGQIPSWPPHQFTASGGGSATLAFQAFATENLAGSTGTYAAVNFGTAAANRVIAIVAICRTTSTTVANTVSSATIGGIAASPVSSAAASLINSGSIDVWYASVPSGTSGTIVVNWSGATNRSAVYVYSILTATPTPSAGNATSNIAVTSVGPTSITIPANGVGLVGLYSQQTGNTQSFTNASLDSSNAMAGAAQATASGTITGTGSVAVTGTSSPTGNAMAMSLAAWGP